MDEFILLGLIIFLVISLINDALQSGPASRKEI